ncbi:MAG: DUF1444 family protein [Blastocatellia bacterium]|nr:DUF1444 family protein [Blastocatellia bacterium]
MGFFKRLMGKPDQDDFAKMMMDALRRAGETRSIEYDPDDFKLRINGENGQQLWLGNAFHEYNTAPRENRNAVINRYVGVQVQELPDIPTTFAAAKTNLLPRVRDRAYYSLNKLRFSIKKEDAFDCYFLPLADHLAVGLVYDLPNSIMEPPQETYAAWNTPFEEVMEAARDNLWNISPARFEQVIPGVYVSQWHDNYDATRLYLHDLVWHLEVRGDHVAAVPNRDTLIVTGSENDEGLLLLSLMLEKMEEDPRPISNIPVILQGKTWVTYEPPQSHPVFQQFRGLRVREENKLYNEQKPLLEAWLQKKGEEMFVAKFNAMKKKDTGEFFSYATWTDGVPTLLPKADEVIFVDPDRGVLGKVPFERVLAVMHNQMPIEPFAPVRYRVETFPTPAQLNELGLNQIAS